MGDPGVSRAVLERARAGDRAAFEEIVRELTPRLYRLAWRMVFHREEAADLTQEVWIRLYRNLDKYDPEQPFLPWFWTVATNACLNWKARKRVKAMPFSALDRDGEEGGRFEPADRKQGERSATQRLGMSEEIEAALAALPEDYRMVVALFYLEQKEVAEIARILDRPEGTIKTWLYRARDQLRGSLRRLVER